MKPHWITPLTYVTVLLFAGALLSTIYDTFLRYHFQLNSRIDELSGKSKAGSLDTLFQNIKPLDATGTSWREVFADYIEQSGWRIRPQKLVAICLGLTALLAVVAALAAQRWWMALLAFAPASLLPLMYVRFRRAARMRRLARAVAAGLRRDRPRRTRGADDSHRISDRSG